jgi:hypothetical protein
MNSWAPLFSKIVDSSLWREDDLVVKVFLTMLAKKDADQIVRANAFMIGEWAKKSEADTLKALRVLSNPDTKRLEKQPYEGRRVEKVEGGWRILNGLYYEEEMRKLNRKEYKAMKQREYRARGKVYPGTGTIERVAGDFGQEEGDRLADRQEAELEDIQRERAEFDAPDGKLPPKFEDGPPQPAVVDETSFPEDER